MAGPREISFTLRAVNAASSVLKTVQNDVAAVVKRVLSLGGALTATAAGFALGKLFKDSVAQAAEAELGMMRLQQTIENVGGSFTELKPDIDGVLSSLAKSTTFKDDDLVAGLQELTIVSGDAKGSIAALGLAADLAKAKKMSLTDASTLLGKVMTGETGMLKRYGIVLKDNLDPIEQIRKRVGGFAANEAKSLTGALQRIVNGWEQFEQALGRALTKGEAGRGMMGHLATALADMEKWVTKNEGTIAGLADGIVTAAEALLSVLGPAIKYTVVAMRTSDLMGEKMQMRFANLALYGKAGFGELLKVMGEWLEQSAGFFDQFGIHVDGLGEKLANLGNKWKKSALADQRENRSFIEDRERSLREFIAGTPAVKHKRTTTAPDPSLTPPPGNDPKGAAAAAELAFKKLEQSAKAAGEAAQRALADWAREQERLSKELTALVQEHQDLVVQQTETQLDDITLAWDKRLAKVREQLGRFDLTESERASATKILADYEAWKRKALEVAASNEELAKRLKEVGLSIEDVANAGEGGFHEVQQDIGQMVLGIQQAIDGALQLAQAFGGVTAEVGNVLRSIAQVAGNTPRLLEAMRAMRTGQDKDGTAISSLAGIAGVASTALPIAGAVATVVGSFLDAAKAARAHAKALAAAAEALARSLADRRTELTSSTVEKDQTALLNQRRDDLTKMLDILVQAKGIKIGTRDEFLALSPEQQRAKLAGTLAQEEARSGTQFYNPGVVAALKDALRVLGEIEQAAAAAANAFAKKLEIQKRELESSLQERELRAAGMDDEAASLALFMQQVAEFQAAMDSGLYTDEQMRRLQDVQTKERDKLAADQQKKREDEAQAKALATGRQREDYSLRALAGPVAEAARLDAAQRREIEDALSAGADEATIALLKFAQAAENAAAASERARQAQRDLEDLDTRLLRAKGASTDADQLEFEQRLQRELEDAVNAGRDKDYLTKLALVQDAERAARTAAASDIAGLAGGLAGVAGASGATSASVSGFQAMTTTQGDQVLDVMRSVRTATESSAQSLRALLADSTLGLSGGGGGSGSVRIGTMFKVDVEVVSQGTNPRQLGVQIGQDVARAINIELANSSVLADLLRGKVGRT